MQKKLQTGSRFNEYDLDGDGVVSDSELDKSKEMLELELREEKAEAQKRIAWIAMVSMLIFTVVLFTPMMSDERVTALADLLGLFYIAQAGIVGAYFGAAAWMSNQSPKGR